MGIRVDQTLQQQRLVNLRTQWKFHNETQEKELFKKMSKSSASCETISNSLIYMKFEPLKERGENVFERNLMEIINSQIPETQRNSAQETRKPNQNMLPHFFLRNSDNIELEGSILLSFIPQIDLNIQRNHNQISTRILFFPLLLLLS